MTITTLKTETPTADWSWSVPCRPDPWLPERHVLHATTEAVDGETLALLHIDHDADTKHWPGVPWQGTADDLAAVIAGLTELHEAMRGAEAGR